MTLSMEMTHVFEVPLDADDKQIVKLKRVETGTITLVADDDGYDMVFELPFTTKRSYPETTGEPDRIVLELDGYEPSKSSTDEFDWYYADKITEVYFDNLKYYNTMSPVANKDVEKDIFEYLSNKYGAKAYNVHFENVILRNDDTGEEFELPDATYA